MQSSAVDRRRFLTLAGAVTICVPPAASAQGRSVWPGRARAAVSLTYDDGLDSQLDVAAPAIEARGWRGTFYITEENMAGRLADWSALATRGHEVGDHTETHPCELGRYDASTFQARELLPMERFLDANFADAGPRTFAYPCGFLGLGRGPRTARFARYQKLVRRDFVAARTTAGGPNEAARVRENRYHLHAFEPTYEIDSAAPAARYLQHTLERGAWAILVFHDVVPKWRADGDASLRVHSQILDMIGAAPFWCAPVGAVLQHLHV